ncbi:MAG: hypothetical protein FWG20_04910, partial [Candidatus Cloacimonetes bacterium]|nr:hypothetical protein [Candidatus Cloacimonadota bacterium]
MTKTTLKQKEIFAEFVKLLSETEANLCVPVIDYLLELGYTLHRTKEKKIEFRKFGYNILKIEQHSVLYGKATPKLVVSFRFSACESYSKVFQEAISRKTVAMLKSGGEYKSLEKCCGFCKVPRRYKYYDEHGNAIYRCGISVHDIRDLTIDDLPELLDLIKEQDEYFVMVKN